MDFKLTKGKYKSIDSLDWANIPELSVITGKNGSGKTQLLELINWHFSPAQNKRNQNPDHPFYGVETQCSINLTPNEVVYIPNIWQIPNLGAVNATSHKSVIDKLYKHIVRNARDNQYNELAAIVESNIGKPKNQVSKEDIQVHLPVDYVNYTTKINVNEGLHQIFQMHHLKLADLRSENKSEEEIKNELGDAPWEMLNKMLSQAGFPYYASKPKTVIGDYELKLISRKDPEVIVNFSDLSSGEKVLVSLTIWMYNSGQTGRLPKLMLLDEPDAHLHPSLTKRFFDVIEKTLVKEQGVKVIMTTHSPSTVSMISEDYLLEMSPDNPRIKKLKSKGYGINLLTEGIITIKANTKYVLVEDRNDANYYNEVFKILKSRKKIKDNVDILFIRASNEITNTSGGCTVVRGWVEKFINEGIDDIFQGLMDYDNGTNDRESITPTDNLHVISRYSLENYLLDPIMVFSSILHENMVINIPGINFSHKDEYRVSKLTKAKLQIIADYIFAEIEPMLTGLSSDEKRKKEIAFINRRKLSYPKWFLNRRGHNLYGLFKSKYGRAISHDKLILAMIRQEFISKDLGEIFSKIQKQ